MVTWAGQIARASTRLAQWLSVILNNQGAWSCVIVGPDWFNSYASQLITRGGGHAWNVNIEGGTQVRYADAKEETHYFRI